MCLCQNAANDSCTKDIHQNASKITSVCLWYHTLAKEKKKKKKICGLWHLLSCSGLPTDPMFYQKSHEKLQKHRVTNGRGWTGTQDVRGLGSALRPGQAAQGCVRLELVTSRMELVQLFWAADRSGRKSLPLYILNFSSLVQLMTLVTHPHTFHHCEKPHSLLTTSL